jgi:hypothetical protein
LCVSFDFVVHHGGHTVDTVQAINRWQHPVALSEALDVLYRAMRPAPYRCIAMMVTEIASDVPLNILLPSIRCQHLKSNPLSYIK